MPRPAGHGAGVFSAQARRRCDFTPCPRHDEERPPFKPLSRMKGTSSSLLYADRLLWMSDPA
ncbi:hypothetical protein ET423_21575 [Salmonella enterica]|nr:hypothetical protein [Salmonella enterica]EAV0977649.1 hypothetical protein [Salmonella enterica]